MIPPVTDATEFTALDGQRYRIHIEKVAGGPPPPNFQVDLKVSPPLELGRAPLAAEKHQRLHQQRIPGELAAGVSTPRTAPMADPATLYPDSSVMDHPILGGKFCITVLCYGNHFDLAQRCLSSVLSTIPPERRDVRVACNQCCTETVEWLSRLRQHGQVTKLYVNTENLRKATAMRQLWHDPECPIEVPYVMWLDDDSHLLPRCHLNMANLILENHPRVGLYGVKYIHDLALYSRKGKRPDFWFRLAPWWKGRFFLDKRNTETPNGSRILFVAGGFLMLPTAAIKATGFPDQRMVESRQHNGIDISLGEAIRQQGYLIKDANRGKIWCQTSDHARRGYSESFPWAS